MFLPSFTRELFTGPEKAPNLMTDRQAQIPFPRRDVPGGEPPPEDEEPTDDDWDYWRTWREATA
jgi:hypothetical protein